MHPKEITLTRKIQLPNFESAELSITVALESADNIALAFSRARKSIDIQERIEVDAGKCVARNEKGQRV